jgi:hypothetical protein
MRITEQVVGDPYKALWAAVVGRAADDLLSREPLQVRSARYWFRNNENTGVGTFLWCCEILNLDPGKTRTAVFARKTRLGQKRKVGTV